RSTGTLRAFHPLTRYSLRAYPAREHPTPETRGRQDASRKDRRLAVLVGAIGAIVLLEGFLRQAVEGEGGDGAFETRRCDAPGAVGAAPAGEVVALDPDQAFTHTSPAFCVRLDWSSAATGGTRQC